MKIKFFITPVYPYGNDHYFHEIIVLAEGLKKLGYSISGNFNYWKDFNTNDYLINESIDEDFDLAIYDYRYVKSFDHLLFREGYPNFDRSKKHILVDRNDWIDPLWKNNSHYKIFNHILGCHTVGGFDYPENHIPWVMGLSNRMIRAIDQSNSCELKEQIGHNFRVWHNLRKLFIDEIKKVDNSFPVLQLLSSTPDKNNKPEAYFNYKRTTRRHSLEYFEAINSNLLFLGFGGYVETYPMIYQPYNFINKIQRKPYRLLSKVNKMKYSFVFQWDSFRMWELFYANTCPIFLNFNKFKFVLPVIPKDQTHYLSIDSFSWTDFNDKLKGIKKDEIQEIGLNGKKWVADHYSPEQIAKRFLSLI